MVPKHLLIPDCPGDAGEFRRGRGRPKVAADDVRRAEITAIARETFLEVGYAGTTMDVVATRCRISKQTLYRLFAGKTELFSAIVVAHSRTMLDLPRGPEDLPLADTIAAIFRIDIDAEAERERQAFIHVAMQEMRQFPEIADIIRQHGIEPSHRLLTEWLAVQRDRGAISLDDTARVARILMDLIFSAMVFQPGSPAEWPDMAMRNAHIRRCIDIFLNGVRPRTG